VGSRKSKNTHQEQKVKKERSGVRPLKQTEGAERGSRIGGRKEANVGGVLSGVGVNLTRGKATAGRCWAEDPNWEI